MERPTAAPLAERLSLLLCGAAVAAALPGLVRPSLLTGAPVTTGNVRGTALIVLVLTVPVLLLGMRRARAGSLPALAVWAGATIALTYQGLLFCFGIPFNALFLPYVAMLGLGAWTLGSLVLVLARSAESPWSAALAPSRFAPRALITLALGNGLVWLLQASPTTWTGDQPAAIDGSGLLTSPVWVQDLAFWIPAAVLVATLALRGRALGHLLTGGMLTFYVLECISVASDQWFGAHADRSHPDVASMDVVPVAIVLGLLILVPLAAQLNILERATGPALRSAPPAAAVVP